MSSDNINNKNNINNIYSDEDIDNNLDNNKDLKDHRLDKEIASDKLFTKTTIPTTPINDNNNEGQLESDLKLQQQQQQHSDLKIKNDLLLNNSVIKKEIEEIDDDETW